jgi:antirestriction protein ArdC
MKAEDLFEKVTADLVEAIEDGARDWRMPWHRLAAGGLPRSVDGRPYAAHEHMHWTGHAGRMTRDLSGRFGSHAYGAEELVAELGAAFWCAQFGLEQATRQDHAAYLGDWLALLRADTRALVAACGHAQRAVDFLNSATDHTEANAPTATSRTA